MLYYYKTNTKAMKTLIEQVTVGTKVKTENNGHVFYSTIKSISATRVTMYAGLTVKTNSRKVSTVTISHDRFNTQYTLAED